MVWNKGIAMKSIYWCPNLSCPIVNIERYNNDGKHSKNEIFCPLCNTKLELRK
jgi:hypothetical protein